MAQSGAVYRVSSACDRSSIAVSNQGAAAVVLSVLSFKLHRSSYLLAASKGKQSCGQHSACADAVI